MSAFRSIEEIVYDIDPAIVEVLMKASPSLSVPWGNRHQSLRLLRSISDIASSLPSFL